MSDKDNDQINKMLEYITDLDSYVNLEFLYQYTDSDNEENKSETKYPVNMKDIETVIEEISSINNVSDVLNGVDISSYNYNPEPFKPIGIFKICPIDLINPESLLSTTRTSSKSSHIAIGKGEDCLFFQIDDLPPELKYEVRNLEELKHFLDIYYSHTHCYTESKDNQQDNQQDNQESKTELFDLRRNKSFRPIMMERYMVSSRFTDPYIYGPYCNPDNIENYLATANAFNISVQYNDILKQEESSFVISVRSKYSRSLITVKFQTEGVICEINYRPVHKDLIKPGSTMDKFIKNLILKSDFPDDLPLDVMLFLAPMTPLRYEKLYNKILSNEITLDKDILSVFDEICTIDIRDDIGKYTSMLKNLYLHENNDNLEILDTIKVNITDQYLTRFKNGFILDTHKLKEKNNLINLGKDSIKNLMECDSLIEYISLNYIDYVLDSFFSIDQENESNNSDKSDKSE
jgi:nitrate reductase NapAB chaperone NapD